MASLTVFKFNTPEGANQMLEKIQSLQKMELIKVQDAAIVTWPVGKDKPKTKQLVKHGRHGCAARRLLGHAVRADLLRPFFGLAVVRRWAPDRQMADYGISDEFIRPPVRRSPKAPPPCS